MSFSISDQAYMREALALAAYGRFTTEPNPRVGAVLVKADQVIGRGYHHQAGQPHAEVFALREAGSAAKEATCYVTLEPCAHYGRTPPCAEALVAAGVKRVVIAMLDPNPLVAGKGVAILQAAGIEVEYGLFEEEARALNLGFLSRMERKRPYVWLKMAASLDGRTALANGQSQWLTSELAREDVQIWRAQAGAILSTAATVLADQARLTVRQTQENTILPLQDGTLRQPLRVILDRQQRLSGHEALFQQGGSVLLCYASGQAPRNLVGSQVNVEQLALNENAASALDLEQLFAVLQQRQINSVWTEAGSGLAGSLINQHLVDELIIYVAPMLLGETAMPLLRIGNFTHLSDTPKLKITHTQQLGPDLRLHARWLQD